MNQEFLSPVKDSVLVHLDLQSSLCLGNTLRIHTQQKGFPDLKNVQIAIIGVDEGRNSENNFGCGENLHFIRTKLYELYPGNWNTQIADLGNIQKGKSVQDTYFAVSEVITDLLKQNITPIIIGGGHDITYANYRAYDSL